MANPILPLNGTHELQERYAQNIVALKRKQNVIRNFFNTDYEGDPRAGAVKIPKRNTEVAINDYDVVAGVALTTSATTYENVLVDQNKAINELIDGYEASAVPDNIVAQRLDSAAYTIGRTQELSAISALETNGTVEATTTETAAADIYATILESVKNVKTLGIDINDIVVAISDDTWVKLLTDTKFSNTASTIGAELIRQGVVSKIGGAKVVTSSNLKNEGTAIGNVITEYIVFATPWASSVEDWKVLPAINPLYDGSHVGASALQGRMVYKDTLLDATTCRVKTIVGV